MRSGQGRTDPGISVASGHGKEGRRDHQHRAAGQVRQGINLVAAAYAEGTTSAEEKRHISPQIRSDFQQARRGQPTFRETEQANQRCGGVARAAAETAARRDALVEHGANAGTKPKRAAEDVEGAPDEIFAAEGQRRVAALEMNPRLTGERELKRVAQRNGLKDRAQIVVAIGPAAENIQA
jgi:hypothetical protein